MSGSLPRFHGRTPDGRGFECAEAGRLKVAGKASATRTGLHLIQEPQKELASDRHSQQKAGCLSDRRDYTAQH